MGKTLCVVVVWLVAAVIGQSALAFNASNVLIVANGKAEGSVRVAEHYATARGVDAKRILKIEASDKEEITRAEYDETVLAPIAKVVNADEGILCIVLTRGVPLKVKATDSAKEMTHRDWASVDGELSLLLRGGHTLDGWIENPFFNKDENPTRAGGILMVTRLDGPTVEDALGLVDKAIVAEALGPIGESFLDTRGMKGADGYGERDTHMRTVLDAWKALELKHVHDDTGPVIDVSQRAPMLHYYGWYEGNPGKWKEAPKFFTGGIGVHLHSFAASTVRNTKQNWVAPLLSWGVTATYGTVYEPFTVGFPYEGVFWDRLAKGYSFAEAGLMSNRLLSWQATFIGDPLYTPYPSITASTRQNARDAVAKAIADPKYDLTIAGPIVRQANSVLQRWIKEVEDAAKKGDELGLNAYGKLAFRLHGWEFEESLGKRLSVVDKAAKKTWGAMKAALKKNPGDTAAYEKAITEWFGLSVLDEMLDFMDELEQIQEREASKLLKSAERDAAKDATILKAWQSAAQAAAFSFSESSIAAMELQEKLEKDKASVLTEQANKALEPHAKRHAKTGKKGLSDKDRAAIQKLIATHPACEQRKILEDLVG